MPGKVLPDPIFINVKNCNSMKEELKIIATKQAKLVLGIPMRTTHRRMNDVRTYFDKGARQPITRQEFCHYFNISMEDLLKALNGK